MEITEDWYWEGYVISSDATGNIFGSIFIQDQLENPAFGLEVKTDLTDSHSRFPMGSRVQIRLKGLFLDQTGNRWALGGIRDVFGTLVLDRIPALATLDHLALSCEEGGMLVPRLVPADSLRNSYLNTLVRIPEMEILPAYHPAPFAVKDQETEVPVWSCTGVGLTLVNSGFSDFQAETLPAGSGELTGILTGKEGNYELLIRSPEDLHFEPTTCEMRYPPQQSDQVLISEIADPENNPDARFLELYNAGTVDVNLRGWKLVRYTNGNTEPGTEVDLTSLEMAPGKTLVFSSKPIAFEAVYGFAPDVEVRSNGPADSNGDDNILLIDPFGEVMDAFGVPGEDGSGTAHEFEDGRALRKKEVAQAAAVFDPGQWNVQNDTGEAGTLLLPAQAPGDYTPGTHPDPDS